MNVTDIKTGKPLSKAQLATQVQEMSRLQEIDDINNEADLMSYMRMIQSELKDQHGLDGEQP